MDPTFAHLCLAEIYLNCIISTYSAFISICAHAQNNEKFEASNTQDPNCNTILIKLKGKTDLICSEVYRGIRYDYNITKIYMLKNKFAKQIKLYKPDLILLHNKDYLKSFRASGLCVVFLNL